MDLREQLSEFSYGYGATLELSAMLNAYGFRAVPFFPNLVREAGLGFDVGFDLGRTALVVQFKLGHELQRYFKRTLFERRPAIASPFWRYDVDTSGDQFRHMQAWETSGAIALYAAPRFSSWQLYSQWFLSHRILSHSLLTYPSDMLQASGARGAHQVLYDTGRAYMRSEPSPLQSISIAEVLDTVFLDLSDRQRLDSDVIKRAYEARDPTKVLLGFESTVLERSAGFADGIARIVGYEAWLRGAQLILVGPRT